MSEDLALLDATAQAELVRTGQVSAAELVTAAIERIEALNPVLNAVVTPVFERAAEEARAGPAGPFAGVPYLVKDLACEMEGVRFTEGSRFLAGNVSAFDSELVLRLRRAGLVILGKTNTPEFGMAPACEPVLFGPTRNPWDTGRSTSGSSGGSAAAVASGMVPFAHGNDLGGSLRYPASACGLFGLKPTRARNPLGPEYGDVAAGGAVEHALTRSVRDSAALLDATSGPDLGDPYWAPPPDRPFLAEVGADPGRLRIGFTTRTPEGDLGHPDCVAAAEHAARLCASLGHEVTETDWPGFTPEVGAAIGTMLSAAAAWIMQYWIRHLGREPGADEIEPLNRALWQAGEKVTAADWLLAVGDIQRFGRRVARFFTGFDAFLTPTMSAPPLPIGADGLDAGGSVAVAPGQRADRALRGHRGQPHRQPRDVRPAVVERRGTADRRARPRPLRRRGHAHPAGRAARGGATVGRAPSCGARGAAAGTVALPRMVGRTNGGAFGSSVCSTWVTVKPAARMESSVGRLQSQHTTSRFSQFSRSCRRAVPGSSDRRCSMNSRRPPGRSTRRSSRSARGWSSTPHRTSVDTATSKLSSSKGRSSAGARRTLASGRCSWTARSRRRSIGGWGSVIVSDLTAGP